MKGIVKRLDHTGHTEVAYDTETGERVDEARRLIESAFAGNALVFDTGQKPGELLRRPGDVNLTELSDVTVVGQFVGG